MMTPLPIIALSNVSMRRSDTEILRGIDLTVHPGEHWALLGANGSGKTSLLKIITGYEWATSGRVAVLGKEYGDCNIPELRTHIGWVSSALEPQLPADDAALDVVESGFDATLGSYRVFSTDERERARVCMEMLRVDHLAARPFGRLSQGEQQRVLIARALVNRPSLLVLDEPCAGLDPAARWSFLRDLAGFAKEAEAPSCLFVTHHIEEIGAWISHAAVLKSGTMLAQGRASGVITSTVLSNAFGRSCIVKQNGASYELSLDDGE